MRSLLALCSLAAMQVLCAAAAYSQNTIAGRALDNSNQPLPNLEVLLHRVTEAGGSTVGLDTTDTSGAFTLVAPAETDTSAIYFVAAKHMGELYMGEMLRLPFPQEQEYVVSLTDPVRMTEPAAAPPPPAEQDRRAGLVVILAGAALVAAVLLFALRRRVPTHRRLLVELANLDDDDTSPATVRRRAHIYARLKRD